ncbi:MAG: HAMP domain-containing protein, partial [Sinobacterium sp.]|nr:HAMP domain-containing protein [Sinobacterium sp.]
MFKRLSISYKISLIAFIGIIGFSIYQGVNFRLSLEIRDRLDYIISEEFPVLRFSNYLQINFNELDKLYQAALAESDIDTLLEANQKADDIEAEFSQIESRYQINHTLFYELSALLKKYRQGTSLHTRHVIENRLTYDEVIDGYTEIGLVREQLLEMQAQFIENRYRSFADNLDIMEKDELFIIQFGLILGALLLIILVVVSAVIIRSITSAFRSGVDFAHSIAAGNLNANLHTDAQDETGQLITSLNAMRKVLKKQSLDNQVREHEQLFIAGLNDAMRGDPRVQNLAEKVCRFLLQSIPSINNLAFYARVDEENFVVLDVQGRDESLSLNNVFEDSLSTLEG